MQLTTHFSPLAREGGPGFVTAKRAEGLAIDVKLLLLLAGDMMRG